MNGLILSSDNVIISNQGKIIASGPYEEVTNTVDLDLVIDKEKKNSQSTKDEQNFEEGTTISYPNDICEIFPDMETIPHEVTSN